jgi:type IV secretory pathway VirB3-like protein
MQTALNAVTWGLSRFAVVVGVTLLAAVMGYIGLVFVMVAVQAAGALGQ